MVLVNKVYIKVTCFPEMSEILCVKYNWKYIVKYLFKKKIHILTELNSYHFMWTLWQFYRIGKASVHPHFADNCREIKQFYSRSHGKQEARDGSRTIWHRTIMKKIFCSVKFWYILELTDWNFEEQVPPLVLLLIHWIPGAN